MTKKLDPDRPNKARRGRPPKARTNSRKLKAIWASPEGRAKMMVNIRAIHAIIAEDRKANPDKYSRAGIPDGHTRASVAPLWAEARRKADRFMQKMSDEGILPDTIIPGTDEAKGVAALNEAVLLALGPTDRQTKMAAIRTVLEYTRAKPASKSSVTINSSEEWLAEIAADDAKS